MKSGLVHLKSLLRVKHAALLAGMFATYGCAAQTSQTQDQKRQAILDDPMGYKQEIDPRSQDGGVTNTNGLGRDLHDFLLP